MQASAAFVVSPSVAQAPRRRTYKRDRPSDLDCVVCLEVLEEPVVNPCGHTLCRECAVRMHASAERAGREPACAACRAPLSAPGNMAKNFALHGVLASLDVHCKYGVLDDGGLDPDGCPVTMKASAIAEHEATCDFVRGTCGFAGCGLAMRRGEFDEHVRAAAVAHAVGERSARLVNEKRLVALNMKMNAVDMKMNAVLKSTSLMHLRMSIHEMDFYVNASNWDALLDLCVSLQSLFVALKIKCTASSREGNMLQKLMAVLSVALRKLIDESESLVESRLHVFLSSFVASANWLAIEALKQTDIVSSVSRVLNAMQPAALESDNNLFRNTKAALSLLAALTKAPGWREQFGAAGVQNFVLVVAEAFAANPALDVKSELVENAATAAEVAQ